VVKIAHRGQHPAGSRQRNLRPLGDIFNIQRLLGPGQRLVNVGKGALGTEWVSFSQTLPFHLRSSLVLWSLLLCQAADQRADQYDSDDSDCTEDRDNECAEENPCQ
jgi:hypothetical protein